MADNNMGKSSLDTAVISKTIIQVFNQPWKLGAPEDLYLQSNSTAIHAHNQIWVKHGDKLLRDYFTWFK